MKKHGMISVGMITFLLLCGAALLPLKKAHLESCERRDGLCFNLEEIVQNGDLRTVAKRADFDALVTLKPHGELFGFERDGILSLYSLLADLREGDRVRGVRYYADETYFEFLFTIGGELLAANEILYPWILKEKVKKLDDEAAENPPTDSGDEAQGMSAAASCTATFKFPYQDENPNVLTSYVWHLETVKYAGDFNWGAGNADCWLSVLNSARGIVWSAGWLGNYGWQVQMGHVSPYWTRVAHGMTDPNNFISPGNDLLQGTFLMNRGSTGKSSGCHTHLEFWRGNTSTSFNGFSCYPQVAQGGTYRSYQTYVRPPKGNP
ncbi:MAG: hypothetical protein A3B74_04280 [Candidatus Kerfeldbacteria bacterium RIFCSPHIGHO2_02_FULL_42_14]|uniref:M23ase beta-sheet core domain-containing protein n=1 Tax=Candidatus Kerfeldbacteria bacterium RIFCSPHIGHO2_02_FULL_42_14 TaxID=1798540 RepID=A0A1G2ANU2_9BACT|nr:MAG: hypothetical protein A3B74_04280 [Candidatus Kerfeldbacteria bacterium RIFCSPHIGHO2_02_FULL_42_14]OGY81183.1 MAG: hypothetical protein A3E60_02740 [Candidatus Kerfeldbacteria bacterium RIFCSPHIGHO2_12_FULL_42_13]OGY83398.1 MAG: hypothetical protein A3I91_01970 [Candidatus Kerfeldbacteria bacterium RIFCSPLOWO2_02_FULL_42_19]